MSNALELKRLKLQLMQIATGRAQTEFRIEEFLDNAERLKPTLELQLKQEAEVSEKVAEMEKELKEKGNK
jgi:hypothetical protein